eukprot:TRINITY_DN9636_c0_g1::TRINITY_DN9636_c0_g1_i1::g.10102::m.10102 TRINITY_DN9636_c0_g1::TRINITY_DN9636_c0_g1_i1::g.10102  ORF type:complete len:299 (-),score=31.90,PhyH/PF05721.8/5.7,PhyH/PF05721.8/2e-10 TRINITY_DN9636_c0_g1_i1:48-944(-)
MPFKPLRIPLDEDGFVKAFDLPEITGALKFFQEYGFVVFREVLSREECKDSIDGVWEEIISLAPRVDRENQATWNNAAAFSMFGIVGDDVSTAYPLWKNRENPRLIYIYEQLFGTKDLIVQMDRVSFLRPTFVERENGTILEKPEWRTKERWLHWDCNPWMWGNPETVDPLLLPTDMDYEMAIKAFQLGRFTSASYFMAEGNSAGPESFPNGFKIQSLLNLTDTRAEDGGFMCVPGFHKYLPQWCTKHKPYSGRFFVQVKEDDYDIAPHGQKVPMRAGSLLVWDPRLPHCSYPNHSSR